MQKPPANHVQDPVTPALLTLYLLAGNYNKTTAGMFDEKRFIAGDWEG